MWTYVWMDVGGYWASAARNKSDRERVREREGTRKHGVIWEASIRCWRENLSSITWCMSSLLLLFVAAVNLLNYWLSVRDWIRQDFFFIFKTCLRRGWFRMYNVRDYTRHSSRSQFALRYVDLYCHSPELPSLDIFILVYLAAFHSTAKCFHIPLTCELLNSRMQRQYRGFLCHRLMHVLNEIILQFIWMEYDFEEKTMFVLTVKGILRRSERCSVIWCDQINAYNECCCARVYPSHDRNNLEILVNRTIIYLYYMNEEKAIL